LTGPLLDISQHKSQAIQLVKFARQRFEERPEDLDQTRFAYIETASHYNSWVDVLATAIEQGENPRKLLRGKEYRAKTEQLARSRRAFEATVTKEQPKSDVKALPKSALGIGRVWTKAGGEQTIPEEKEKKKPEITTKDWIEVLIRAASDELAKRRAEAQAQRVEDAKAIRRDYKWPEWDEIR
jgi:hypothetical protein